MFDKCAEYKIQTYEWEKTKNGKVRRSIQLKFLSKVANVVGDKYLNGNFVLIFGEKPSPSKTQVNAL